MPKRISDVSLHVYVTPESLERVVDTVRGVVDDHLQDRDVFAWRFTLPVEPDDPAHIALETQWRLDHTGQQPGARATYEIALSLVGAPTDLTDTDINALERHLLLGVYATSAAPDQHIPYSIRASQRTDVDLDSDHRERI